jgi:hypothetical protein
MRQLADDLRQKVGRFMRCIICCYLVGAGLPTEGRCKREVEISCFADARCLGGGRIGRLDSWLKKGLLKLRRSGSWDRRKCRLNGVELGSAQGLLNAVVGSIGRFGCAHGRCVKVLEWAKWFGQFGSERIAKLCREREM